MHARTHIAVFSRCFVILNGSNKFKVRSSMIYIANMFLNHTLIVEVRMQATKVIARKHAFRETTNTRVCLYAGIPLSLC